MVQQQRRVAEHSTPRTIHLDHLDHLDHGLRHLQPAVLDFRLAGSRAGALTQGDQASYFQHWMERWDRQQQGYLPLREVRFEVLIDYLELLLTRPDPLVVDLGAGPGSLSIRILDRLPSAQVVALDGDPVLLELGRQCTRHLGDALSLVETDLRDPRWLDALPSAPDAVVSTTALHWLTDDEVYELARRLADTLPAGGVFLNGDNLALEGTRLDRAVIDLRDRDETRSRRLGDAETWEQWWAAIAAQVPFADAVAARTARWTEHPDDDEVRPRRAVYEKAFRAAGFAEVGVVWQLHDDCILAAVR